MFLGEPIPLGKYLYVYKEKIMNVVNECADDQVNTKSETFQLLLKKEMERAEMVWFHFYERNGREPDHNFLMDNVLKFGTERLRFIDGLQEEFLEGELVEQHLGLLKLNKQISGLKFSTEDRTFILNRETYKAKKMYAQYNEMVRGYESQMISQNK